MTLANLITLAHVRRQLKLEDRALSIPRVTKYAVMAFEIRMQMKGQVPYHALWS